MGSDKHGRWWVDPLPEYVGPFAEELRAALESDAAAATQPANVICLYCGKVIEFIGWIPLCGCGVEDLLP